MSLEIKLNLQTHQMPKKCFVHNRYFFTSQFNLSTAVETARIPQPKLQPYSLQLVRHYQKGRREGLGSSSSVYSPMKRQGAEGEGRESKVFLNPKCLDLGTPF